MTHIQNRRTTKSLPHNVLGSEDMLPIGVAICFCAEYYVAFTESMYNMCCHVNTSKSSTTFVLPGILVDGNCCFKLVFVEVHYLINCDLEDTRGHN